jgi:TonB family protein
MLAPPSTRVSTAQIGWFIGISIGLHLLLLPGAPWFLSNLDDGEALPVTQPTQMRVRVVEEPSAVSPTFAEATRAPLDSEKKEKEEEEKEKEKKKKEQAEKLPYFYDPIIHEEEEAPTKATVLSRQARKTEKETVKSGEPGAKQLALVRARADDPSRQDRPAVEAKGTDTEREDELYEKAPPKPKKEQVESNPEKESASNRDKIEESESTKPDVVIPEKGGEVAEGVTPESSPVVGRKGSENGTAKPEPGKLFPTIANTPQPSDQLGNGGTFNYLKDVAEGERTLLNQKRSRYWTFWDRMTRQVRREWSPIGELKKRDPFGNVYGVGLFYTRVDMVLNGDGTVRKLHVAKSSGLDFLDDEAIRALNAAAPFPNPPEGLKDEDGLIHIRFGFAMDVQANEFKVFQFKPKPVF